MGLSNYLPSSRISQAGVIPNAAARPASPYEGQIIYETDTNRVLVWDNAAWVSPNSNTSNPPGIELITQCTATFSGGTAGSVSNGVVNIGTSNTSVIISNAFSTSYVNYRVVVNVLNCAGTGNLNMTLDNVTGNVYYSSGRSYGWVAANGDFFSGATSAWFVGTGFADFPFSCSFDVFGPQRTGRTYAIGMSSEPNKTNHSGFQVTSNNQNTGFTLAYPSGSITGGTITVYGYRN